MLDSIIKIEEYFKYILTKVRLYNMFGNHKIDITKDVLNINVIKPNGI